VSPAPVISAPLPTKKMKKSEFYVKAACLIDQRSFVMVYKQKVILDRAKFSGPKSKNVP